LGLLSDTHGDAAMAAAAVRLFNEHKATAIIHLGDVGTDDVLEELVGFRDGEVHLVFGNCDDAVLRGRHAERLGLQVHHPAGLIEWDGRRVGFTHGHLIDLRDPRIVEQFILRAPGVRALGSRGGANFDGQVDYLLHGHSHQQRDERIERPTGFTRVINPGALHRAAQLTVALLEPESDRLQFFELAPGPGPETELEDFHRGATSR